MKLRSLFYFVLLAAILFAALRWQRMVHIFAVTVGMSYLYAFSGFAAGAPSERLRKGGFLFGGLAYLLYCALVGGRPYDGALFHDPLKQLHFYIRYTLSSGAYVPDKDNFILVCHLAISVLVALVCYWSFFAYARWKGI